MRRLVVAGAAVVAAAILAGAGAAPAFAGTLTRQGSTVVFTESDSDAGANDVDIVQSATNYYIGDRNEVITDAGSGCSQSADWLWYCGQTGNITTPAPTAFRIDLGGGGDRLLPNQYGSLNGCCSAPDIPVTVDGGPGDDNLTGALSQDVLMGGFGSDILNGGPGTNDRASYEDRTEAVTVALGAAGAGDGSANDGPAGSRDTINDADIEGIVGGEGADTLSGDVPSGSFAIDGRGGADVITGSDGPSTLMGGDGNDTIGGGSGDETLEGGDGDDEVDGGFGSDSLDGEAGTGDRASYATRTEAVTVDLGNDGADDGSANDGAPGGRDTIDGVEGVIGGSGGDAIDGSTVALALTLEGRDGGDRIQGGLGPNTIRGQGGNDVLEGRAGADILEGGDGHDTMDGLGGADTVLGGAGFDSIEARDGIADSVDCGADDDAATTDAIDARSNCDQPPAGGAPGGGSTVTVVVPSRLVFDLAYGFTAARRSTTLKEVSLEVERGARVTATCRTKKGKRCRRTRDFAKASASATVRLRAFEGRALPVGSRIQLRATRDGMIGVVKTLTIRKRKAPSLKTLCIPPGATRPSAC